MSLRMGAAVAVLLVMIAAALWARRTYAVLHPTFALQSVETSTYRASYPAHWEPIDAKDSRLGEKEVVFLNHRSQEGAFAPYDRARVHMTLKDEGDSYADLEALTAALLKDAEKPGPVETWALANGVAAKTWLEHPAATDIPSTMRWLAFRGPNGRSYSAGFAVPRDWKTRNRYEHIFRDILGSLEFKGAAK